MDEKKKVFFEKLEEMREKDPLIGAKIGSEEIYKKLVEGLKNKNGSLNCTYILIVAGALAGMACQKAVWKRFVETEGLSEEEAFVKVKMKDGKEYYFGNRVNYYLLESKYSVCSLIAGMYHHLRSEEEVPNIIKVVEGVASNLGNKDYELEGVVKPEKIVEVIKTMWKDFEQDLNEFCKTPDEWPVLFALTTQKIMDLTQEVMADETLIMLPLESAIYISKCDFTE